MNEAPTVDLREKAEKRVAAVQGFKRHLFTYIVINAFLIIIWLITALVSGGGAWFPWFVFVLVGWGIGLGFNAYNVYGGGMDEAKREEMVQQEMQRMKEAGVTEDEGPGEGPKEQ